MEKNDIKNFAFDDPMSTLTEGDPEKLDDPSRLNNITLDDEPQSTPKLAANLTENTPVVQAKWRAWSVVLGSFIIHAFVFGNEFIYGVYAEYYTTLFPNASSLSITLVGSVGSATTYIIGMFAGVIADRWGYRTTGLIGCVVIALGCVLASFATQLWHLYLTQGILFGIGSSLVYFPALSAPTHWFPPRRWGLVIGIAVSGVGVGGLFMAPLTQLMIDRLGIAWALRITGIGFFIAMGSACMLLKERNWEKIPDMERSTSKANNKPKPSLSVFKELNMVCLVVAQFAASFGFLVPFYFLSEYAVNYGYSADEGADLIGVVNAASSVGRIAFGILGDRIGHVNVLSLTMAIVSMSVCIIWSLSERLPMLVIFSLVYGATCGGYVSTVPVVIADIYGPEQMATLMGWLYTSIAIGNLVGTPIAGALLDVTRPHLTYVPMIEYSGAMLAIAAVAVIVLRVKKAGWGWVRV